VQHAHQKGIIHRDLKPSNVLVSHHDTAPVAKVIDFGVAKALGQELTDKTLFTGLAQMIGTPLYMSPEQAELSGLDVDTRSDVYSLGVLLYELLTGHTPFDQATLTASLCSSVASRSPWAIEEGTLFSQFTPATPTRGGYYGCSPDSTMDRPAPDRGCRDLSHLDSDSVGGHRHLLRRHIQSAGQRGCLRRGRLSAAAGPPATQMGRGGPDRHHCYAMGRGPAVARRPNSARCT
jgi:serine/threonine protein kinase